MSDTVRRIEDQAFCSCGDLTYIKLSTSLEYIGMSVFEDCENLSSIFIPPSCMEIRGLAFQHCRKLIILSVPRHRFIVSNADVIRNTALIKASPFEADYWGVYASREDVVEWIKSINANRKFKLHRLCSSFYPNEDHIYRIIKRYGSLRILIQRKNSIGVTPLEYLSANLFADIDQGKLVRRFVLEMMGETV